MKLFGFEFRRVQKEEPPSFVPPQQDDGAAIVSAFGAYGTVVDLDGTVRTEAELISKYREMSLQAEIDGAIEHIVNEAIVVDEGKPIVELVIDPELQLPENIKQIIHEEFKGVLKLLQFNTNAYRTFKRFYIDGRMFYHVLVDPKMPQEGVAEIRYIDPRKIRKVREVVKIKDKSNPEVIVTKTKAEYYIFNEAGFNRRDIRSSSQATPSVQGLKIAKDSIIHITSDVQDANGTMVLSYLHKAIRIMNQLRAMEDATIIYRISRAPERRVFYIDVGNLPKAKAEQHLRDVMVKHKNKLVYDAASGEIRDDRRFMTMLEDYWLPRRGDAKATEITTLEGGQNLGEMTDVNYFRGKLYEALNVPISRLDPERVASIGRATEIGRDEIIFVRFIDRMRNRFSQLFSQILQKNLILKGIITPEDWEEIKDALTYRYARDIFFSEMKDGEVRINRFTQLQLIEPYVGRVVSWTWVRKNVLMQTEEEIEQIDAEIAAEMEIPQYNLALMAPPADPTMPMPPNPIVATNGPLSLPPPQNVPSQKVPPKKPPNP